MNSKNSNLSFVKVERMVYGSCYVSCHAQQENNVAVIFGLIQHYEIESAFVWFKWTVTLLTNKRKLAQFFAPLSLTCESFCNDLILFKII